MAFGQKDWNLLYFIINIVFVVLFAAYLFSGITEDRLRLFIRSIFLAISIVNAIRYGKKYFELRKEDGID